MTPVALRSNYSQFFGSAMLPVLEELFQAEFEIYPSLREQLFKIVSHDRDIWQSGELQDLDLFNTMNEGEDYSFGRMNQGASKTLSVLKYGLGVSISREAVEDGKFDFISMLIKKLARSAQETQQINAMNIFNNGFSSTVTTADAANLFSASHLLPSGLTWRNKPSVDVDLSPSTLDSALQDFATQQYGDSGILYHIRPKVLLVAEGSSNKRYAMELIGSDLKADTADNNLNSFKQDGLRVVASPHLTDSDAWFLCGAPEETGLRIIQREPVQTMAADPAVGFINDSILYKSRFREVIGAIHGYGLWATSGG